MITAIIKHPALLVGVEIGFHSLRQLMDVSTRTSQPQQLDQTSLLGTLSAKFTAASDGRCCAVVRLRFLGAVNRFCGVSGKESEHPVAVGDGVRRARKRVRYLWGRRPVAGVVGT